MFGVEKRESSFYLLFSGWQVRFYAILREPLIIVTLTRLGQLVTSIIQTPQYIATIFPISCDASKLLLSINQTVNVSVVRLELFIFVEKDLVDKIHLHK